MAMRVQSAAHLQCCIFWKVGNLVEEGHQFWQLPVLLGKASAQEAQSLIDRVVQLEEKQELISLNAVQCFALLYCLQIQLHLRLVQWPGKTIAFLLHIKSMI